MQRYLLALAFAPLCMVGCAPTIPVPGSATLLYYGPGVDFNATRPTGAGRAYLKDETLGRVVAVISLADKQGFHFSALSPTHVYSVYFERDGSLMAPEEPATKP